MIGSWRKKLPLAFIVLESCFIYILQGAEEERKKKKDLHTCTCSTDTDLLLWVGEQTKVVWLPPVNIEVGWCKMLSLV